MSSQETRLDPGTHGSSVDFDRREPSAIWLAGFAISSLVLLVAIIAGVSWYFDYVEQQQVYEKQLAPVASDLLELRAKEEKDLNTYGWVDKAAGAVRIPVNRAIELYLAEAASGKLKYPTTPQPAKPEQGGATNAQPAAR
jgi:hypothetical protein